MPESVILSLFDYDGCLSHRYMMTSNCKDIIYQNKSFLKNLTQKYKTFFPDAEIKVGCMSARQSKGQDISMSNINKTGACYFAIQEIATHLNLPIEPLLLADVYGDLAKGTSFLRSLNLDNQAPHASHIPDRSKLTILHAQIHSIAEDYPDKSIYIDCYDDIADLLFGLINFYSRFPEMIPSTVTICFNYYEGEAITELGVIEGTGEVDFHYRQTVIDMITLSEKVKGKARNCISDVTPEKLMKYRNQLLSEMPNNNEFAHLRQFEKHAFMQTYKTESLKNELNRWQKSDNRDIEEFFPLEKMKIEKTNESVSAILQQLLMASIKMGFFCGVQLVGHYDPSLLNQIDNLGLIPLHEAVNVNCAPIVEYLIRKDVSLDISTIQYANKEAMDIAVCKSYNEIATLLSNAWNIIRPEDDYDFCENDQSVSSEVAKPSSECTLSLFKSKAQNNKGSLTLPSSVVSAALTESPFFNSGRS